MKRTNSKRNFFARQYRLLLLVGVLLAGCGCGVILFHSLQGDTLTWVTRVLPLQPITGGFGGAMVQVFSSCFQVLCLVAVLFLGGLSAWGAPLALGALLFWGIGLGMTLGYYYASGGVGVLFCAVMVLPPALPEAIALLIAASQTLHLSVEIAGQLLPRSAHCGGLWQEFRRYGLRFLSLLPLLFAAGVLHVGLRLLLFRFFTV